jgi:hypothetical protein
MRTLLIALMMVISCTAFPQTGVVRLELEGPVGSDIYQVVPCDRYGVVVFYETKETVGEDSKMWYFVNYDENLRETWKSNIAVPDGARFQNHILSDTLAYLAFLNPGKSRPGTLNFLMLTIDLKNGISYETKCALPSDSDLKKMVIRNTKAYLAIDMKNEKAAIYTLDLKSAQLNEFQIVLPDGNFIDDLEYDPAQARIMATVSNYLGGRQNKMYLLALTLEGNYDYDMEISTVLGGKYLNTAKLLPLESGSLMIVGSYGNLASKIPSNTEYFGVESAGLFSTRVTDRQQEFMNYYNFMEFRNLRAGVSARDFYRLQKKKGRETAEYSLNYELLAHEPVRIDTNVVVMFEAFYPEFRTVSDIGYDMWGRPVTNTYTVFEGYRFFNSILAGFNTDGELIWDNSLEISISPMNSLRRQASYFFDGEPVLLFYNDGYRVSYRVCLNNAELEPFSRMELETSQFGDRITDIGYNRMVHWYGMYFLAYGYHTIQNNSLADRNQRSVFYINKIALD